MGTVRYHLKNLSLPMRVPLDQLLCGSVGPPGADLVEQVREVAVVCDLRVRVGAEVVVGWLVLEALVEVCGRHAALAGALYAALTAFAEEKGIKSGAVLFVARAAVSGLSVTPGGATEIMEILGKDETLARLATAEKRLG